MASAFGGLLGKVTKAESNFLLFRATANGIDPDKFRSAITSVGGVARVSTVSSNMAATVGTIDITVRSDSKPMAVTGGYQPIDDKARSAIAAHKGWTSVTLTTARGEASKLKDLSAKLRTLLIDKDVLAVWSTETGKTESTQG